MRRPVPTNDYERELIANVERFGWQCTSVAPAKGTKGVSFSYTIGFYRSFGQPEFIICGLAPEVAHSILTLLAEAAECGNMVSLDEPCDSLLEGYSCVFVEVPKQQYGDYVRSALWFHGDNSFPLYQVVWPDKRGRFPWHAKAGAELRSGQPVLGEFRDA